ncbi:MAG TPA: sigma factor-like helix-turn-helix DNA-binding protein [Candidatus Hydrogenedentes bacterium]|nr:sigma factor-like helix-turn-helix DNA-binding protein [Candidatus Hydrogenedentota bacterium]
MICEVTMKSDIRSWDKYQDKREAIADTLRSYRKLELDYMAKWDFYQVLFPRCVQTMTDMPRNDSEDCELERIMRQRVSLSKIMGDNLRDMALILERIAKMVEALPPDERTVLYRHYMLGETFQTVADKMNYSERTVRTLNQKAIDRMAKQEE